MIICKNTALKNICIGVFCKKEVNPKTNCIMFIEVQKNYCVKKKALTPSFVYSMISQVRNMNEIVMQSLLYDFYGELLTDNQKEIYEQFILEDLSLGEIAKERGISRQGVHDTIRRCEKTLEGYEEKLSLIQKFLQSKKSYAIIIFGFNSREKPACRNGRRGRLKICCGQPRAGSSPAAGTR